MLHTFHIPAPKAKKEDIGSNEQLKEQLSEVKDELCAIRGPVTWVSLNLDELYLTIETTIPKRFKMPDFTKHDRT